ncbi:ZnF_C2H2 [Nesidiocoris tenuis]|uniref:ZnF_C2H2 n=2 Tax=Nesidiocoris tenuis TaxID=355587 RepID=A0ABN7ABX8_9HEMI|nr:ZnF_C2H2 [Nesidiocoris tenuis]
MKVYRKDVRSDRQKATVCRMCLARHPDAGKAVDIFVEDQDQNHILPIIKFCIGLECCKEDGLSPHICMGCHQSLNVFFAFKSMCLASEVYLKRMNAAAATAVFDKADEAVPEDILPIVDDDDAKEPVSDELSLAENNDMVILETDDVHPGTPYEVLRHFQESVAPPPSSSAPAHLEQIEAYKNVPEPTARDGILMEETPQATHLFVVEKDEFAPSDGEKENVISELGVRFIEENSKEMIRKTVETSKNLPVLTTSTAPLLKPHTCQVCLKEFRNSGSLYRHALIHDGKKPHGCPQCGKRFTQKESLKRHLVSHSDSRFVCHLCDKCLKSKEGLRCHMRTHHSDRSHPSYYKYKCKFCEKCFAHASGLSRHSAIHKGVVFSCDFCPRKFTDKSPWKKHKEKHLKETPVSDKTAVQTNVNVSDCQLEGLKIEPDSST